MNGITINTSVFSIWSLFLELAIWSLWWIGIYCWFWQLFSMLLLVCFISFNFSISAFNAKISWSRGWLLIFASDCLIYSFWICFPLTDFSCWCSVGFSPVWFVSLITVGFSLMFFFKTLVYEGLKLPCWTFASLGHTTCSLVGLHLK